MTSFIGNNNDPKLKGETIGFPDFEVSWAGGSPWSPGSWFGSHDGFIRFFGIDGHSEVGPYDVSPAGEAINGMAFTDDMIAVSTGSDVVFLSVPHPDEGKKGERAVFYGGSHGVAATQNGRFVAAMGMNGVLLFGRKENRHQKVKLAKAANEPVYIYKIAGTGSSGRGDVICCAARKGGFLVLNIGPDGSFNLGKRFRAPGVDFIDVCSLNSATNPRAAAALGLDRSIHLTTDALLDRGPKTLRVPGTRGRAYKVFAAAGHLFMLTSKALYLFIDLVSRYLDGDPIDGPINLHGLEVEAVDASAVDDKVLMVLPDCVYGVGIAELVARGGSENGGLRSQAETAQTSWEEPEDGAWSQSEERELATVG